MHARIVVVASLLTACAAPTSDSGAYDAGGSDSGARQMRSALDSGPAHRATEHVYVAGNLPEAAPVANTIWDPTAPFAASMATSVWVYDANGAPHDITLYFVHTGEGVWELHAVADGFELAGGPSGPAEIGAGITVCDTSGIARVVVPLMAVLAYNGAPPQTITLSFDAPSGTTAWPQTTCTPALPAFVSALEQDGF